ncbi:hypothetical protein LTR05_003439 [Lithohypha guttulata]|uniref:Leucine-rich repeat-containing protein n=1 Tax=Lithohypha guttulata TaxID=1690604 RepID=A0AAN7T5L6_9EURO|nr:hypothetical protein LTR05_003439 [Lithohypha guttulata]
MESLQSQDAQPFVRAVAQYIRQHEKALANSLQLTVQRRKPSGSEPIPASPPNPSTTNPSSTSALAAALSFAGLNFKSHSVKSAQLTLTPHHLFVLLSRIEELDVDIGPMNVRVESIHNDSSPANYVSFLQSHNPSKGRSDADSIHSVSSVRSVMSNMSALWSGIGLSAGSKSEKARLALEHDLKYVYGAFTKLPSLRLTPDHRTPLIKGYEQFPFDTAVPLFAFKNVQQLEIIDLDFRSFHGWDRLAEQLCLLTIKRGNLDDPLDLLENIVLDDAEKRRRRSNRWQGTPSTPSWSMPSTPQTEYAGSHSDPGSPQQNSPGTSPQVSDKKGEYVTGSPPLKLKNRSQTFVEGTSPKRPTPMRPATSYRHNRTYSYKVKRSGSGGSGDHTTTPSRSDGVGKPNPNVLPASKWQRLVYLSLADNGITSLPPRSIQAIAPSLRSFNLSSNLFTEIPESLSTLSRLVSLDLSNCMLESLRNLTAHPLPGLVTLKLKSNRLQSLSGIEQLLSLENLNVQDNKISDPDEAARLTQMSKFKRLWIKYNPLTKAFPDYRVRILSHFRKVPGFVDDVVIDEQPATYTERKQLIERASSVKQHILHREEVPEAKVVLVQETPDTTTVVDVNKRLLNNTIQRTSSSASTRPKRSQRRRIVDLSENESTSVRQSILDTAGTTMEIHPALTSQTTTHLTEPALPLPSPYPDTIDSDAAEEHDYKLKVEELRLKFGNTWLSALDEHKQAHWQSDSDLPTLSSIHPPPPQLHHYQSSPSVVGVGGIML